MIAHPLKTVFVHIPKTAGSSIEQQFLSYLGLDQQSKSALLLREKLEYEKGPPRLAHLTAAEYREYGYLDNTQAENYFFFTTVRNPWDRVQSFYRYLKFDQQHSLNDFVLSHLESEMSSDKYGWFLRPQTDYIYDQYDQLLVDQVCRQEQLQTDFDCIIDKIGLSAVQLPVINTSQTQFSNAEHQEEYLSDASIKKIESLYQRDITLLGYQHFL